MANKCEPDCPWKVDLDGAAVALNEASKVLSDAIKVGSDDLIESAFAAFRAKKAWFFGVLGAYREHRAATEASQPHRRAELMQGEPSETAVCR